MKSILLQKAGGVENLIHTETSNPIIQENEVLVKVKSISINPVDVKARANKGVLDWIYGDVRPLILGWDISGEIIEKGDKVTSFQKGDKVFGMVNFIGNGAAYAEYVAVPFNQLAIKPENISYEECAGATLAALTSFQALVTNGSILKGQKVLIHAGSGGVGHYAIQIAKHLGAYIITTSSLKNRDFVMSLGADEHIDYKNEKFYEKLDNIDFVLDTLGNEVLFKSINIVKPNGKIITLPSGDIDKKITEKAKKANVDLSFMLVQSNGNDMHAIANLLESKIIKSHISAVFSFDNMDKAHLQVETGRTIGKVVVSL